MNTLNRMNALKATAANVNAMPEQDRIELANHLLAKYSHRMIPSLRDRVESMAYGFKVEHVLIGLLEDVGIEI